MGGLVGFGKGGGGYIAEEAWVFGFRGRCVAGYEVFKPLLDTVKFSALGLLD
jgi:hypothetical protein